MKGSAGKGSRRKAFGCGVLVGAVAIVVALLVLDATELPDRFVAPLGRPNTDGTADAVVVLAAAYYEPCGLTLSGWQRTLAGVRLWRAGRAPRLVFTGGPTKESREVPVSRHMADLAVRLGVPRDAILEESASHDTHENATLTAALLGPLGLRRVVLVTDGIHMRRADACFRHEGFDVERASVPQACVSSSNLAMMQSALHEYAGWIYYRWKGWVSAR